ncbi:molybdopterin-dependent oxidoreductase [Pseudooceanicola sp. CBS1P-1]|uniref:Molybdopterin-dependent oxidoreductase n=1 Tax=Pseudooceanicola albus TaxID=2692189 RepID=A0A6L7G8I9_9RHOB|nr:MULTISPECIES: molybdopterin-dependent oxidoreductase [Pseudooceanicola]MBT9384375.1 molybdopterin-dependent oxidoreductase [Pseudooceanicola endophyticus]MXN19887.1 molybdopterin-dependent oxidoreductase [Pseudooceanicola albus]
MELFASHFGTYEIARDAGGPELRPFRLDPAPSEVGAGFLALADHPTRIRGAMVRRGWLAGDGGAGRGNDDFVALDLEAACGLAARELMRVRATHGNRAIFGGAYGWGSAGRFHHPQSQLKKLLNLAGGFVSARNTYSYGTAKVLIPHLVGAAYSDPGAFNPSWDRITATRPFLLSFGGMRLANAQVEAGGTGAHRTRSWIEAFAAAGGEMTTLSPDGRDAPMGDHLPLNAGTDAIALLAMAHVLLVENRVDEPAVRRIAAGYDGIRALLLGHGDGQPKTPAWAEALTGLPAERITALARRLSEGPALINLAWSLQRAVAGEQPYWAAVVLATLAGQIGRAGCGIACGLSAVSSVGNPLRRLRGPAFEQGPNPVPDYIPVARITEMLERPGGTIPYNGETLSLPDIRLVWWAGGNPFHHHQDLNRLARAWRRPETVIVHDSVWTATARHADIVFPSALPFERDDIAASSRDDWIVRSSRVMAPPEGIETDHAILSRIAARLGLKDAFTEGRSEAGWIAHLYEGYRTAFPELPDWETFCATGHAKLADPAPAEVTQPLEAFLSDPEAHPLATPSGRIELMPALVTRPDMRLGSALSQPRPSDLEEDPALPLRLLSPQPETRLHSQLDGAPAAEASRQLGCEVARLHPSDMAHAGVADGTRALLENPRGAVLVVARADGRVMPGHVVLPTGGWYRPEHQPDGRLLDLGGNPNTLTRDAGASELSQGASAGGARVALRPA